MNILDLLKEALKDPAVKSALKEMVQDDEPIPVKGKKKTGPAKKQMAIFEVNERDIPEIEREANKKITVNSEFRKSERPEIHMVTKRCGCGRSQDVMAGGPLDTEIYVCNKCLVR